jgi:hypothetical protein
MATNSTTTAAAGKKSTGNHASKGADVLVPEPQATGRNAESIQTGAGFNKAAKAREIFNEVGTSLPRKDVIKRFQDEAMLTPSGAATYYQNMKKDAGLVAQGGPGNTRAQNNPPEKDGGAATAKK